MRRRYNKVSKNVHKTHGSLAVHSIVCSLIDGAENGRRFLFDNNSIFTRARKIAKANGILVKYDRKNAEYYAVKMEAI